MYVRLEVTGLPTYEYECPKCSSRFEQRRSFSEESKVTCPKCRREARRIFSPVPIIFKGSGFYVTDHKSDHGHSSPTGGSDQAASSGDTAKAKAGSTEAKAGSTEVKSKSTEQNN